MKIKISYSSIILCCIIAVSAITSAQVTVPGTYATINAAIAGVSAGATINLLSTTYNENVVITKSITLKGIGGTSVISPSSGIGITISANSVTLSDLRVANVPRYGIYALGRSNLTFTNVICTGDSIGAALSNIIALTVSGSSFSQNNHHGFYSSSGNSYSFTNCSFNGNGTTIGDGSGMKIYNLTGGSVFTNCTVDNNKYHGMEIRSGCSNLTVNGGDFSSNGTSSTPGSDGGGIYIASYSGSAVSNVTINGPLTATNNSTAGIYADAQNGTSDLISTLNIGQSGVVTLTSNGITQGAGILLWGNIQNATVTANFSKGSVSSSAGIIIIGRTDGTASPANTVVANSTFNPGYSATTPAISLTDQQPAQYKCYNGVTASGNTFLGLANLAAIDAVIYDHNDNSLLGLVTKIGNVLPVELVSFEVEASGNGAALHWTTATEVNNYGFDIERCVADQTLRSDVINWQKISFVRGSGTSNSPKEYSYTDSYLFPGKYAYRLHQIDNDGTEKYSESKYITIKGGTKFPLLSQNYPNPFNPTTNISFALANTEYAKIIVYNMLGQQVSVLFDGIAEGEKDYHITFDASNLTSGIYFYKMQTMSSVEVRKMQFIR